MNQTTVSPARILAISGSLRVASINSALLRAAARLAPPAMSIALCSEIGALPLFNPDLESQLPSSVARFRRAVSEVDALLIASPEYAHGVTGAMKNALDWLVGDEHFAGKPVAVLNASPRAYHADTALRETLRTMAAVIVEPASVVIPQLGANLDEHGIVALPEAAAAIREMLTALSSAIASDNDLKRVSILES